MDLSKEYISTPPMVIHQWAENRPFGEKDIDAVIDRAKDNAHLTRNEASLLRFYAKCGGGKKGFPAALQLVLKRTGIADKKGWRRARRKLESLYLITYRNDVRDHFIRVNWKNICEMAIPGNKILKGYENYRVSVPVFRKAVDNISPSSKEELIATVAALNCLSPRDWKTIAEAVIPEMNYKIYVTRKDKNDD